MGAVRAALELGVGLGADPVRVVGELDELDEPAVRRGPRAHEAVLGEAGPVVRVELVAVAVPLADHRLAVRRGNLGARFEHGVVGAEAHRAALVGDVELVVHQVDDRVLGGRVHLGRVGIGEPEHVAAELDGHRVQAEAQPEARHAFLAGVAGGGDLALEAAGAEPAGDHHPVEVGEPPGGEQTLDLLGLDPVDLHRRAVVEGGVLERLDDRQVGVGQAGRTCRSGRCAPVRWRPRSSPRPAPTATGRGGARRRRCAARRRRRRRGPRRGGSAAARRCCGRRRR